MQGPAPPRTSLEQGFMLLLAPQCDSEGAFSPTKWEMKALFLALPLSRAAEFCGVVFLSGE